MIDHRTSQFRMHSSFARRQDSLEITELLPGLDSQDNNKVLQGRINLDSIVMLPRQDSLENIVLLGHVSIHVERTS